MLLTGPRYDPPPTIREDEDTPMRRTVTAHLAADVDDPALLALQIAVAGPPATEELVVTSDGKPVAVREIDGGHGGRVHALGIPSGRLVIDYIATVHGSREVPHGGESDLLEYRRPSRYCPSDKLLATAASEFGGIDDDAELVAAVRTWVHNRLVYTSGSSGPTDDAVDTLLLGAGVCRDFAHLTLSLLRARDVPARLAAVYAPRAVPHGLPRRGRGVGGRRLAAGRRDPVGATSVAAADRDGPRRRGHRVPHHPRRARDADRDRGHRDGRGPAGRSGPLSPGRAALSAAPARSAGTPRR